MEKCGEKRWNGAQERERAEKILKEENEEERQKRALMERTDRLERGILFRRNENQNQNIAGEKIRTIVGPSWVEGTEYYYLLFNLSRINKK